MLIHRSRRQHFSAVVINKQSTIPIADLPLATRSLWPSLLGAADPATARHVFNNRGAAAAAAAGRGAGVAVGIAGGGGIVDGSGGGVAGDGGGGGAGGGATHKFEREETEKRKQSETANPFIALLRKGVGAGDANDRKSKKARTI